MKLSHLALAALATTLTFYSHAQTFEWGKQLGGTAYDYATAITVDGSDNVYSTGQFQTTADFDPGPGVYNLSTTTAYQVFVSKLDAQGDFVWAVELGGPQGDYPNDITIDPSGNVILSGTFGATADMDPGAGTFNLTSMGSSDVFVCKLDPDGNFIWAVGLGGINYDYPTSLDVDVNGNIYVTGLFRDTVDFNPGPGVEQRIANGYDDGFLLQLFPDGSFADVWVFGGIGTVRPNCVDVDDAGNKYLTGYYDGDVDLDPGPDVWSASGSESGDLFISKLDPNGDLIWVNAGADQSDTYGNSIAVDQFGNIYVAGEFYGTVDFDAGSASFELTSEYGSSMFLSKLGPTGAHQWTRDRGEQDADHWGSSIDVDVQDKIYMYDVITRYGEAFQSVSQEERQGFQPNYLSIQKWNPSGILEFDYELGPSARGSSSSPHALFVTNNGDIHAAANFAYDPIDVDPGLGVSELTPFGNLDILIHKMSQCLSTFNSINVSACGAYTVPSGDETYNASGTVQDTLVNACGGDSILTIFLTINYNTVGSETVTACDSMTWAASGMTYTTSGTYFSMLVNAAGCDSLATLDLTVNYSNTSTVVEEACDNYLWSVDGNTYDASGSYTAVLTNAAGCDSTITLDLTVNYSSASTVVEEACDSYLWAADGNSYDTSGSYTAILTNTAGCDSTITLDLTINNSTASSSVEVACDSFFWDADGNTYDTSGNYTALLTNAVGCDSTVTLDLTIGSNINSVDVQVACDSFFWIVDDNTYDISGSYTAILTTAAGCDSTITLDLTVNSSSASTSIEVACDSFLWDADGNTYDSSGSYTAILTNAAGCDSTITLDLSILNSSASSTSANTCTDYFWDADGNTYDSSGTYSAVFINAVGCDSTATLFLTVDTVDVTVITIADTAFTASATNAVFQWLDCANNNEPVPGATSADFAPTTAGSYAVEVTQNGCTDTSACSISTVGIASLNATAEIVVFPNPTDGQLNIVFGKVHASVFITVHALDGRQVAAFKERQTDRITTELDVAQGNYLIQVYTDDLPPEIFKVLVQ
ncbi:MAG: SBBP repeat-containing protein [Flavobacteriales bacterium]